jgi:hypothetical protein
MVHIPKNQKCPAPASNPTPANAAESNPGLGPFSPTTTFSSAKRPVYTHAPNLDVSLQHKKTVTNVDEKAWGPGRDDAHKRQAPPPNPQCPPSVFPATMTISSTKKRKTFPTIKEVGDLIEVSS